jgi:hypothetical protein
VGRALALDAMIPIALAFVVALFLRETRPAKMPSGDPDPQRPIP